jgi:hypothetical protein
VDVMLNMFYFGLFSSGSHIKLLIDYHLMCINLQLHQDSYALVVMKLEHIYTSFCSH